MAAPPVFTLNKSSYLRGETIIATLVREPGVFYTWGSGWGNTKGNGAGQDITLPVAGTTVSQGTDSGWGLGDEVLSYHIGIAAWHANPDPDGIYGSADDDWSEANLIGKTVLIVPVYNTPSALTVTSLGLSEGTGAVTAASIGAYVQNVSALKWNIAATGGAVVSAELEFGGVKYPGATGEAPKFSASGTIAVTGRVTDSLGRTATRTENITVLPYEAPKITSFNAFRSTSGGVEDDNGTYARMTFAGSASALTVGTQKNRTTYTLRTRPRGTETWTTRSSATASTSLTPTATITPSGIVAGTAYEVRIDLSDLFGATAGVTFIAKGGILMDWGEGKVGIGKEWAQGTLDVGGPIYQDGNLVVDASRAATTALAGITSLATNAEAQAGTVTTKAVTPAALQAKAATNAEAQAGTSTARFVTPAGLASRTATETRTGIAELATQAEVNAGTDTTRIVSPATLRGRSYAPWAMAAGSVDDNSVISAGTGRTTTVTLPAGRFTQPPVITVVNEAAARLTIAVISRSTTEFQVRQDNWSGAGASGRTGFMWQAIQMTAGSADG